MSVTLDNIPAELRLKIYRNLFILPPMKVCKCNPQYNLIPPDKRCHINMQYKATSQLLRVCQLFFNEGVPILYEENEFLAGSRHCTNLFMAMLEKRDGYIDEIKSFTFGGLDDFKKRYGFAVIERAPRLKNLRLGGNFLYDSVEVTQWDKSALIRQGEVVQAGSIIHDRLPAFPQAKMDRFARKGTNIVAITKVSMVVSRRSVRNWFNSQRQANPISVAQSYTESTSSSWYQQPNSVFGQRVSVVLAI
jgi:hypothetical protein